MTATGSVATIQMGFVWLDTASVLRGRFAEKLLALGGLPTALRIRLLDGSGTRHE